MGLALISFLSFSLILYLSRVSWFSCVFLAFSFYLANIHFQSPEAAAYMYDLEAHKALIVYFSKFWWPEPLGGWLSYHPPLYYYLGAIVYKIEQFSGIGSFYLVRYFNVFLFFLFQLSVVKLLERRVGNFAVVKMLVPVICFFPLLDIFSTRINNDSLLYPLMGWSLYWFYEWLESQDRRKLNYALLLLSFGIFTKSNAYILAIFYLLVVASYMYKKRVKVAEIGNFLKPLRVSLVLILVFSSLTTGRIVYSNFSTGGKKSLLVANYRDEVYANQPRMKFKFPSLTEMKHLFYPPFPETYSSKSEGFVYPIHLIKTFLYGESIRHNPQVARVINFAFLGIVVSSLGFVVINFFRLKSYALVYIVILLGGHLVNSYWRPVICTSDARYIFFIIQPFLLLLGENIEDSIENYSVYVYPLRVCLEYLLYLFSVSSLVLLLVQHILF